MKISSLEKLDKLVSEDEKHKDARIVRFVNVETLELWCKVKNLLSTKCERNIHLSDYCKEDDLTPKMAHVLSALKEIDKSTLLIPLSEHLRINNCNNILSQIAILQFKDITNIRLYEVDPVVWTGITQG